MIQAWWHCTGHHILQQTGAACTRPVLHCENKALCVAMHGYKPNTSNIVGDQVHHFYCILSAIKIAYRGSELVSVMK